MADDGKRAKGEREERSYCFKNIVLFLDYILSLRGFPLSDE